MKSSSCGALIRGDFHSNSDQDRAYRRLIPSGRTIVKLAVVPCGGEVLKYRLRVEKQHRLPEQVLIPLLG
jgi:hypothetical protein